MGITAINPIAGTTSFVTSAAGSYLEDARNMGMTEEQSLMYGTIMGAVEGGTEAVISGNMLEHGAKLLGVNSIKREALHKVVSSFGFDIAENFAQEALTEPLNEGVKYIVSGNEYADFSNMGARMLKSGIDGAVSAIILAGNSVGINSAIKLSERIKSGKSISQEQIKKVVEDCKSAGMPVDDILIESVKENTNALSQAINENNTTQIQELQEEISKKQQEWKQSTDTREKQIIQEAIDNLNNELQNITTVTTQNSISQTQSKENSTYLESARRYNIDTNNQTVKAIEQVTSQREIQTRFDGDVFANNSVNALWRTVTNSNGKTVREVVLNPNADTNKTLQNVIVHELTHDIEGSKEYSELKDLITNYDKNNIDYESARKSLEEIYSKVYDKNSSEFKTLVENEAVADILGSKLGDQEFITNLTTKKPSIAKRIYNWVVDKLNKINKLTGYKNEKVFWNDVKNKFENAYRQDYQGINTNAKYHVSENFANEIDKALNNELASNTQIKARDYTPTILVNNGVKNLPMLITQRHIKSIVYNSQEAQKLGLPTKNINYHGLGKNLLIKAIDNLDSPRAIYKTNDNNYLVITKFKDSNGREIVVPVQINGKGRYNDVFIDENQIKSVYGRNNLLNYLKSNHFEKIYEKNRESDFNEGIQYSNVADSSINNSITPLEKDVNTSKYSMQESKNNTLYSIAGKKGMTNLVKNNPRKNIPIERLYDKAQQLQKIGIDNEIIRQQTNWFQDRNGDWKFEFSDKDMAIKDNLNLQSGKSYKLGDVLKHNTLFTAYPELAEYNLNIINDNSIKGSFSNKKRTINISDTIVKSREKLEGTLIHEIQHAIQHIEGFEHGRSSKISKLAYYNSLGEIEASNTKERFLQDKYNNKDISNTPPESSKKNPQHKGLNRYIKERNILEKMKDSVYNYFNKKSGGNNDEINQEVNLEDSKQDNTLVDGRKIRRYVNEQEAQKLGLPTRRR